MGIDYGVECAKPGCDESAANTFTTVSETGPDGRWYCPKHR